MGQTNWLAWYVSLHTLVLVVGSDPSRRARLLLCPCRNAIKHSVWALSPTPLVSRPAGRLLLQWTGVCSLKSAHVMSLPCLELSAGEFLRLTEDVALIIHCTMLQCYRILNVRSRKCTAKQMCLDLRAVGLSSRYHVNVPSRMADAGTVYY